MGFDVASFYELRGLALEQPSVTHLSFCDPPMYGFGPPSGVQSALRELDIDSLAPYPDFRGLDALLRRIGSDLQSRYGPSFPPENLLTTNGLHEAFSHEF